MLLIPFLAGAVTFGFLIAALFFCRFWRRTGTEIFLFFSLAFVLLAIAQGVLALSNIYIEEEGWAYLLRLAAFVVILVGIWRTNRPRR